MSGLFLKIINMSISASWLVLAVLLFRFALKKAPKWINVLLWGIVAVRLAFPFSVESALSLIPSTETFPERVISGPSFHVQTGIIPVDNRINDYLSDRYFEGVTVPANNGNHVMTILTVVWIIGILLMVGYTIISYWRLRRKVSEAVILRDNIFQSENVSSPFVLGIFRPRIYLPYHMNVQDLSHVVAHEQAHIRRRDHWWKPLGFLLLTIHWFNPLMWLAYVLLCRDIELACDEKVIKELGNEERADYTQALVVCSVNRRMIAACPLAFGEVGVKERVKSVMNYKKPAFWVVALAIIACVVVAVCFLTDPLGFQFDRASNIIVSANYFDMRSANEVAAVEMNLAQIGELSSRLAGVKKTKRGDKFAGLTPGYQISALLQDGTYIRISGYSLSDNGSVDIEWNGERYVVSDSEFQDYLSRICVSGDVSPSENVSNNSAPSVIKWFDYLEKPAEMKWNGSLEINLPEFPDVTFRWSYGEMVAVKGNEITSLYTGMPIWNTYFCDLTGDGLPELCSTISWGSGMIDNRAIAYDYANNASYSLQDRGVFDYTLRQNESDGQLYVDKSSHVGGGVAASGRLVFQDDCLQILGQNVSAGAILKIIDPTENPDFNYATAVEKIYEDENNEYFLSGLYSQYVIVHYTDGTQEDIVAALNSGRATIADLDKFGIRYWAEPKADPLDAAISAAILDHYRGDTPDGLIHVESHILLGNETVSGTPVIGAANHVTKTMVYLLVHHVKYSTYGGTLTAVGGSYVPAALTFKISDSGEYIPEEYWEPRDGSYYVKDIRGKFPGTSADDALNDQAYIEELQAQTYNKALAYLNSIGSLDVRIAELLDEIQSSPAYSSNPGDYIEVHEAAYKELLSYGEYTLRYCFDEFLQGGQTGLRGHIMRALLDDLAPEAQLRLYAMTGQEYFDEWKAGAIRVSKQHDMEWIEKNQPAIRLLLQMMEE